MSGRARLVAAAVLAAGALTAPAAEAAITASITPADGLRIDVVSSESDLNVRRVSEGLLVTEFGDRQITPGNGCVDADSPFSPGEQRVRCNFPPLGFLTLNGGNFRDELSLGPGVGDCLCFGSSGDDELKGGEGADLIDGGNGDDELIGGPEGDVLRGGADNDTISGDEGNDTLDGGLGDDTLADGNGVDSSDGGDGSDRLIAPALPDAADIYSGGGGFEDLADYSSRRAAVSLSPGTDANDGASPAPGQLFGERDTIRLNIEQLAGGAARDSLTGTSVRNSLFGNGGDDTLRGGTPPPGQNPTVDDVLDGGVGADLLRGDGGNDRLMARDAIDDQAATTLECGPGADILDADVRDDDTRPLSADCEQISQGMVDEDPNVRIRSARRAGPGSATVKLRCPRATRRGCAGKLSIARSKASFGPAKKYRIKRGKGRAVTVALTGGSAMQVRVRSIERGRLGPRTTFRTLRLRP